MLEPLRDVAVFVGLCALLPTGAVRAQASAEQPVEVKVSGSRTAAERLQQSAEAVNVIGLSKAKQQTVDLGEVLARTQGVAVRRYGGLGSSARFSLNGLYDNQVRFFLDAVPLEIAGYPFGIANVPVNLIEHVEVYRGVVPIRFGADALGGGVNLSGIRSHETRASASYQIGSFGTHRLTLQGGHRDEDTGAFLSMSGFYDYAKNDYDIDVKAPDARGRPRDVTVRRFHDAYRAYGLNIEGGVVDRPWAKQLSLRGFLSGYHQEIQHNVVMTVPFGEATDQEMVYGLTGRYDVLLAPAVELEVIGSYARRIIDFDDMSRWIYNWFGKRVSERPIAGEISQPGSDSTQWQNNFFGRALAAWTIAPGHIVRAALTPGVNARTGDERNQSDLTARDPLNAERSIFKLASGIEYESNFFGERLANIVFVKDYFYHGSNEEQSPQGDYRRVGKTYHSPGVGDTLRYRFTSWLLAKASYEYAMRLPESDEVFGNGALVSENFDLAPEKSHNANVGPRLELKRTPIGDFIVDINAFLRESDNLIVLLGLERSYIYRNVNKARGFGIENMVSWTSPGRYVALDGTLTWQDVRNTSSEGTFGAFDGDRIPNRPYFFGSWGARLRFTGLPSERDAIEPFYYGRYVHAFFRGWESVGQKEFKQSVDTQMTHSLGVTWSFVRDFARWTATFEIDNLTDAKVFDNFGVQRPGRAYYCKVTADL